MSFHRDIQLSLNSSSIDRAIREIRSFKKELIQCCNDLVRVLTEEGITIAKMNVMSMNAVQTGALEESIKGVFFPSERVGVIFTDVPYALFVEFGTGIVGKRNPHEGETNIEWDYDIHAHGDSGWVYYMEVDNIRGFRWTKGMPARPYMYNTLVWLKENAPAWGDEAFRNL